MMSLSFQDIKEIEKQFGNPFYLFDEAGFIENYVTFQKTFRAYYPRYQLSYSFKTNYTPFICKIVKGQGGFAEVVSGMEYDLAKRIGFEDQNIIFNGPNKGERGLEALHNKCIINIDNLQELEKTCAFANKYPYTKYEIGLRVNLNIGQSFISRFGMDEAELKEAFHKVSMIPNLSVSGLHCHISRCRGIEAWRRRTEVMLNLAERFFPSEPPRYLDLGSGMFGKMDPEFAVQFTDIPSYEEYAQVTAALIADHYKAFPMEQKPVLITEPGTTLVNKYMDFVGRVDAIKSIRGKVFAVLNCSEHNLGETCQLKRLPIRIFELNGKRSHYENVAFTGYTCLEQDVMYDNYNGELGIGDYVQFGNVGGYSNVYKPPFIWPNCCIVAKTEDGGYELIKQAETFEDVFRTYLI